MKGNNTSIYRLAKESHVPCAAMNDVCNSRAQLEKHTTETIYRIVKALKVSMEDLQVPCFVKRSGFENYKRSICHRAKEQQQQKVLPHAQ